MAEGILSRASQLQFGNECIDISHFPVWLSIKGAVRKARKRKEQIQSYRKSRKLLNREIICSTIAISEGLGFWSTDKIRMSRTRVASRSLRLSSLLASRRLSKSPLRLPMCRASKRNLFSGRSIALYKTVSASSLHRNDTSRNLRTEEGSSPASYSCVRNPFFSPALHRALFRA